MKNQTGARFIRREKEKLQDKEVACLYYVKKESDLIRISDRIVKRINRVN